MSNQYWFYSYTWETKDGRRLPEMGVWEGSFTDLVYMVAAEPERWVITFTKEITKEEYDSLDGHIG